MNTLVNTSLRTPVVGAKPRVTELQFWRGVAMSIWRRLEAFGERRAVGELYRLANYYDPLEPELAHELRAAACRFEAGQH